MRRCFAYPNWTGPVKVPFPCQCAGKLANLMEKITDGHRLTVRGLFLWLAGHAVLTFEVWPQVHAELRKGFYYL